jgi:hypothetical protein
VPYVSLHKICGMSNCCLSVFLTDLFYDFSLLIVVM